VTKVTEISTDIYRISTYVHEGQIQFNQFLINDDEPLLYHTGPVGIFKPTKDAVASVIDPSKIRWIAFSHLEADECGSINEWLDVAPNATPVCSLVGAMININDISKKPPRPMKNDEVLTTGKYKFRFIKTPHVPHAWDAGHFFEETSKTLLCSDLLHQNGECEPVNEEDVIEAARQSLIEYQMSPFAYYMPYTPLTEGLLQRLADLKPKILAIMHGSTFIGDGQRALLDLAKIIKELSQQPQFLSLPTV
jgi:flavorubredoxin